MSETDDDPDPALIFPGPVAVVAGPGSGKTTVLAKRIKHLVEELEADPEGIAVITFTREAARNMKERLTPPAKEGMPDVALPLERHPQTICTMHSLGARIIAQNCDRLGITSGYRVVSAWQVRQMLFEDAARLCGEDTGFGRECDRRKQQIGTPEPDISANPKSTLHRLASRKITISSSCAHDSKTIVARSGNSEASSDVIKDLVAHSSVKAGNPSVT